MITKTPMSHEAVLAATGKVIGELKRQQANELKALAQRVEALEGRAPTAKPHLRGPVGGLRYLTREL
jgi:hypothetical protein